MAIRARPTRGGARVLGRPARPCKAERLYECDRLVAQDKVILGEQRGMLALLGGDL